MGGSVNCMLVDYSLQATSDILAQRQQKIRFIQAKDYVNQSPWDRSDIAINCEGTNNECLKLY